MFQFPTGWNSTRCVGAFFSDAFVSIPNGMEFYCVGLSLICLITRSIPNGMEFYFTLPTPPQPMMAVSIPNGMEFYVARPCLIHRGLQGLNSQRDGILLYVAYPAPAYDGSFNSQRDGILRGEAVLNTSWFAGSQFPTGWNFTLRGAGGEAIRTGFQFPTGWNSTSSRTKGSSLGEIRFNSQRDGILRDFDMSWKDATSGFQFPTGWNSTPIVHIEGSALYPFQFPTGWNYAEAGDD